MSNRLREIETLGQSIWIDNISRQLLEDGVMARLIEEDGISGVTSNPTIFEKAMGHSDRYDDAFRVARQAQLADDKDVQRRAERAGHFVSDRHAAARQCQHKHVRTIGIGREFLREQPARFPAIAKEARLGDCWTHVSSSPCVEAAPTMPLKVIHDLDGGQCEIRCRA